MKMLELHDVTVRIPVTGGHVVHAVTDADVSVDAGEVVAIVGESGCGKSVLAATVTGILPPHAEADGKVVFRDPATGEETELLRALRPGRLGMLSPAPPLLGRRIALVPQSAATFLTPVRTVGDQLDETIRVLRGRRTASELLDAAGLDESALQLYPHELSGGMAQRAAVSFALAGDPCLVVADEPTASLDPRRTTALLRLLRGIADDGAGVLLITHDISELRDSRIADEVAVMYASRIVESGPPEQVLHSPKARYTRDLLAALPENGLHPMPGIPPELTDLPDDYSYERRLAEAGKEATS